MLSTLSWISRFNLLPLLLLFAVQMQCVGTESKQKDAIYSL